MTEESPDNKYEYLGEKSRELVNRSKIERIDYIKSAKWIDYTGAKNILAELEELITWPQGDLRPPCRLIIGDSNNGKSSIIERFLKNYPSDINLGGDAGVVPVVSVSALRADEKYLYAEILAALFETFNPRLNAPDSQLLVISTLQRVQPRLIIVDEVHELAKGPNRAVTACQSALKAITNKTRIPIAAFGTIEALNAFGVDEQMENRFEPLFLRRWKSSKDYRGLLVSFEKLLPLRKPSNLKQTAIASEILERSGGLLGEIKKLLTDCAIYAIEKEIEQITVAVINSCKYRPVNRRRTKPL